MKYLPCCIERHAVAFNALLPGDAQIPSSFFPKLQPIASLLGGIICLASLAAYCAYQVSEIIM